LYKYKSYLNFKKILFFFLVLFSTFYFVNEFYFNSHSERVSIFLIDAVPRHTKRWIGGVKELSPARWDAHTLIEGKNVVCDIPSSIYSAFKKTSANNRIALVHFHYSLFSNEIICEQLDFNIN
jgi:hypothetical protein